MTDAPITNQDLQMTLAQIEDTLAQAANPAALFEGAKAHLGALYNNAEAAGNDAAMIAINESWNHVQSLATAAQQNREAYLTAKDIAGTFQTQRDDVMKELEDLTEAVENADLRHPKVAKIYEEASDQGYQDGYENAMNDQDGDDDYAYDLAWEILEDKYNEAFGESAEARFRRQIFIDIMSNDIEVQPNRLREFFAWLDAVKADNVVDKAEVARELREWQEGDDDE
jgi:hypothetical protein